MNATPSPAATKASTATGARDLTGDPRPDPDLPEVAVHGLSQDIPWLAQDHLLVGQLGQFDPRPAGQPVR